MEIVTESAKEARSKIIFFDFDGVIADTFDLCFGINKQIDPRIKAEDDYTSRFNGNINDWKKDTVCSEEEIRKSDEDFFGRYIPGMAKVNVFPGIKETIKELAKTYTLIIISSTIASPIKGFMERNELRSFFEKLDGDMIVHNNKTERINNAFEKYGVGPKDCVFITDTLGDMREAASCGIPSIGVTWGFHKKNNLEKGNPFKIAETPEELIEAVADYFKCGM